MTEINEHTFKENYKRKYNKNDKEANETYNLFMQIINDGPLLDPHFENQNKITYAKRSRIKTYDKYETFDQNPSIVLNIEAVFGRKVDIEIKSNISKLINANADYLRKQSIYTRADQNYFYNYGHNFNYVKLPIIATDTIIERHTNYQKIIQEKLLSFSDKRIFISKFILDWIYNLTEYNYINSKNEIKDVLFIVFGKKSNIIHLSEFTINADDIKIPKTMASMLYSKEPIVMSFLDKAMNKKSERNKISVPIDFIHWILTSPKNDITMKKYIVNSIIDSFCLNQLKD